MTGTSDVDIFIPTIERFVWDSHHSFFKWRCCHPSIHAMCPNREGQRSCLWCYTNQLLTHCLKTWTNKWSTDDAEAEWVMMSLNCCCRDSSDSVAINARTTLDMTTQHSTYVSSAKPTLLYIFPFATLKSSPALIAQSAVHWATAHTACVAAGLRRSRFVFRAMRLCGTCWISTYSINISQAGTEGPPVSS